ncbi:MAG: HlyD family secretion protein [Betaproteobacteria bacterium]|nr:HlyD family secretion protein [Betaproteobacteria bacterium]
MLTSGFLYVRGLRTVSTDDAYVASARTQISTNVSGRVVEIEVRDNQPVHRGDLLFKLDARDFEIAVTDARARLAQTRLEISGLKAAYRQRQAEASADRETLAYQEHEYQRQKKLASQGISSQAQLDQAEHAWSQAKQKVLASEQAKENALAALDHHPEQAVADHPAVRQAQAALDRALLNLSYTTIKAPQDGIVSKVEQLQVGDYVNAASPLFALVSARNVWVEANFRETDLARMHPGQPAAVEIDAYPGRKFHGRVQSLSPGTGSSFSLLPPENATGNWVKVVQRLPVRISIDDADPHKPLQAGLSATVDVDLSHEQH